MHGVNISGLCVITCSKSVKSIGGHKGIERENAELEMKKGIQREKVSRHEKGALWLANRFWNHAESVCT
jgi:hypothetical protein